MNKQTYFIKELILFAEWREGYATSCTSLASAKRVASRYQSEGSYVVICDEQDRVLAYKLDDTFHEDADRWFDIHTDAHLIDAYNDDLTYSLVMG